MVKALSVDLRKRVVAAVDGGISRNQAAARFGVSIASAVRWCDLKRRQCDVSPKRQGGDRKSGRIEAEAPFILATIGKQPDITLAELQALLHKRKQSFGLATYLKDLGVNIIDEMLAVLEKRPSQMTFASIWKFGGAMQRVKMGATAFSDSSMQSLAIWIFVVTQTDFKRPAPLQGKVNRECYED